jgi:hypothetical protein
MITLTREEAQELLNALTMFCRPNEDQVDELVYEGAIELLSARLSAPEPEPVAWRKLWEGDTEWTYYCFNRYKGSEPLYTTPPQREWQGLTDEEMNACLVEADPCEALLDHESRELMRTVEAKLREKNGNL